MVYPNTSSIHIHIENPRTKEDCILRIDNFDPSHTMQDRSLNKRDVTLIIGVDQITFRDTSGAVPPLYVRTITDVTDAGQ